MSSAHELARVRVSTALGEFTVEATARGLRRLTPGSGAAPGGGPIRPPADDRQALAHAHAAAGGLRRYAAGEHVRFDGPFDLDAPALHLAVWERLRAIPFGETATYGEIAQAVGQPGEARAIGGVVGANPVCVLIPCHRVVGADGTLRGFAWGLDLKRRLLAHEGSGALALFAEPVR
jgi:O-6-methylguanine DNA methyltransferase